MNTTSVPRRVTQSCLRLRQIQVVNKPSNFSTTSLSLSSAARFGVSLTLLTPLRPHTQAHITAFASGINSHTKRMNYSGVATPERCYVDFCLIPVGTASLSVANEVAAVQKLLKESGLTYTMHSAGTTVEGSWDEVMAVVGKAHAVVHAMGVGRVQSSMRVGTRTDKKQTAADKVKRVEDLLAEDKK
ncbi:YkoF-like protein [Coniella lustricola]|uniref:YkoF-like protein n=1 Tax=Coniella lustricola TaxID=2025994 RepID=A0A2T2ZSW6_9PEZI|nr:YkoF-like protein [Coniella lustricola]